MNLIGITFLVSAVFGWSTILANVPSTSEGVQSQTYPDQIRKFRDEQEAELKKDEGWLSLIGLFWLHQGSNSIGSDSKSEVVLPISVSPPVAGTIYFDNGKVILKQISNFGAFINGKSVDGETILKTDSSGAPDKVQVGTVSFMAIVRGKRTGIRLYDKVSKARSEFQGMKWFPVDEKYRVEAQYHPYNPVHQLMITNVLGDTNPVLSPGYLTFEIDRKQYRLETQTAGRGLFINFHDLTCGKEAYPAGRFLDADAPVNGKVLLDFNRSVNPPCAFTTFATCPLAPRANYLEVRIPVGELSHHPH